MDPFLAPGMGPPPDPTLGPPIDPVTGLPMAAPTGMPAPPPAAPPLPLPDPAFMGIAPVADDPLPPPEPVRLGPRLPSWYKKPRKPKLSEVLEEARREKEDHTLRLWRANQMLLRLNGEYVGHFERDKEAIDAGEIEVVPLPDLIEEHNGACAWIAGMDWTVEAQGRESFDREEVAAIEDYCHLLLERWGEDHSEDLNARLEWALCDVLQKTGMLVACVLPDREREDTGVSVRLIDPLTVFPVAEGGRGLRAVYVVSEAEAASVIGDYGYLDEAVERKVRKIAKTDEGRYDPHHEAELVAYYDANWTMVAWGGELLAVEEHGLGKPPFVVRYGGLGMQNFTSTPDLDGFTGETPSRHGEFVAATQRAVDLARRAQPFLWRRVALHDAEEAFMGRLATWYRRNMNPPVVVKQGILSAQEGDPEIDPTEGGVTKLRDDDAMEAFPNNPIGEIVTPMLAMFTYGRQISMAPGLMMGQNPAAQTSGSAMTLLAQGGFEKWSPLVLTIQDFLSSVLRRALEYIDHWGEVLGPDADGVLYVPRRNPSLAPDRLSAEHELTPEIVRRVGIRVKVTMTKFNPQSLGTVANGGIMLKSLGIADKRTLMRIMGFTNDIEGTLQRVDEDLLNEVPEVKQLKTLKTLVRQAERALAAGDEDSAEEAMADAQYIAGKMQMKFAMQAKMAGLFSAPSGPAGPAAPAPGPSPEDDPELAAEMGMEEGMAGVPAGTAEGMPGVPPDPAAALMAGGAIQAQGQSLPGFGIPTGTNGGRPPGAG